ncbi:hypothetical protein ACFFRR_007378 [Megaselia abdita]
MKFNNGDLKDINGSPILLDALVPQDQDVLTILERYRKELPSDNDIIGHSMVPLSGANECKLRECNLGNLVLDAMVYARVKVLANNTDFKYYTDASIAFLNAGGIRSSIDKKPDGSITKSDIKLVLPFKGKFVLIEVSGHIIRKVLDHSASEYGANNAAGGILQMAGLSVTYNFNKTDPEEKVRAIYVVCANCDVPVYEPFYLARMYKIIVPIYLYKGGGGYKFSENDTDALPPILFEFNDLDVDYVLDYLRDHKIVYPGLEDRINFEFEEETSGGLMFLACPMFVLSSLFSKYTF